MIATKVTSTSHRIQLSRTEMIGALQKAFPEYNISDFAAVVTCDGDYTDPAEDTFKILWTDVVEAGDM